MQPHVILAVFRRQLAAYFASPTGYVFITIFVFLASMAAFWTPAFFDRNLANLDQLTRWFPALLLFLAPAIAMGAWAEERRDGTDELLLSLPASAWDLALGKHLACVAIYTVALLIAAAGQVAVLLYLGSPDVGMLLASYAGQWLAGSALLAVAMAASALTSNLTVAFVLGAAACLVFVGAGALEALAPGAPAARIASRLSLGARFDDFSRGVITLEGLGYFLGVTTVGVWASAFLIGRSHWKGGPAGGTRSVLGFVRGAALLVAALAGATLLGRTTARADVTAERLWSLSPETRAVIRAIPDGRTVLLTAYISPASDVPATFTQTRENLLGTLKEIEAAAGAARVQIRIVETTPYSEAAREAQKSFSILARPLPPAPDDPNPATRQVWLGVAAVCGAEQAIVPFFSRGLPVEYELARMLRAVSAGHRKKIGVLETEAGLFGRFNFQTYTPSRDWPIIDELRKQHEVVKVPRRQPIPPDLDALIVAQPSSLAAPELPPVLDYLRAGRPALILEDPLPLSNPGIATSEPRGAGRNPFQQQQQPEEPKCDIAPLWALLGVAFDDKKVAWDAYNPRPQLADLPREFVFVGRNAPGAGVRAAGGGSFNDQDAVTSGLQEIVMLCPGGLRPAPGALTTFTPMVQTSPVSGTVNYSDILTRSIFGFGGFNPNRKHVRSPERLVLAARITGASAPAPTPEGAEKVDESPRPLNVILLADLDAVSEEIFRLREEGMQDLQFDNVTLVLNAVDSLAGEESLVELRKRRRAHRTLSRLETRRLEEQRQMQEATDAAGLAAEDELGKARSRLDARVKEIEERADLDETGRRIMVESVRQAEQRRLDVQSAAIEDAKQARIDDARAESRREIDAIEMRIRLAAVALPPIPAFLVGCAVFARRRAKEKEGVGADRLG